MTVMSIQEIVDSIKRSPEYGYNGHINDIREREYPHLGGRPIHY